MKNRFHLNRLLFIVFLLVSLLPLAAVLRQSTEKASGVHCENAMMQSDERIMDFKVPDSCTIFTVAIGDTVYYGNNEDSGVDGTYMWVMPSQLLTTPQGDVTTHGAIGFGYKYNNHPTDGYVQGGMNDQGLCADGNGLPTVSLNPHPELETPYIEPLTQVLFECSTVDDVITWFQTHNCGTVWGCQLHFADASGDAVVVSVGTDGEFSFTQKSAPSHYLVSTNFNLADYTNGAYPCSRYTTVCDMLDDITSEGALTVEVCRDILDAVHAEGEYGTKYSNIFDPVNRRIYLYQLYDFTQMVTLVLDTELALVHPGGIDVIEENGMYYREIRISALFELPPGLLSNPLFILAAGVSITGITIAALGYYILRVRRPRTRSQT